MTQVLSRSTSPALLSWRGAPLSARKRRRILTVSGTMSHTLRAMTSGSQQVLGLLPKEICFQADQFHTICFGCTCVLALRFVCCRLQCTRRWAVLDAQRRLLPWHILLRPLLGYDRGYWWTVRCLCYGTYKNCKEFVCALVDEESGRTSVSHTAFVSSK